MPNRSTADVLLELLDLVPDADRLDRLLDTANVLKLLLLNGRDDKQIRAQLTGGWLPGELLIQLIKERGVNTLWQQLDQPYEPASTAGQSDVPKPPPDSQDKPKPDPWRGNEKK